MRLGGRSQRLQWTDDLAQDIGGHLGIEGSRLKLLVPEQHLDHPDIDLLLQQMGGITLTVRPKSTIIVDRYVMQ